MLSIVVTWRDRVELERALPALIESAQASSGDLTIVNYGGDDSLLAALLGARREQVCVVHVERQRYFHKARAQNVGASRTRHPFLFFSDCDIVYEHGTIARLLDLVRRNQGTFGTFAGVHESRVNSRGGKHVVNFGYELRIRTADGRSLQIVDHEEDAQNGTRQAPGLLLVRREDFLRIGGYNGELHGWGWEDQDMIARLTLGAGLRRICEGNALHLSHDDEARVRNYPVADRWESRDRMFRQALQNYDLARFLGTYPEDVDAITRNVQGVRFG